MTDVESARRYLDGESWPENERRIANLVQLIRSGEAVAMVGAGISAQAGFPTWPKLLTEMAFRANAWKAGFAEPLPADEGEYLSYADRIKQHFGRVEAFENELAAQFRRGRQAVRDALRQLHRDLIQLPFRVFLTTNYEDVLETAWFDVNNGDKDINEDEHSPIRVVIWRGEPAEISKALRRRKTSDGRPYFVHIHGTYTKPATMILCGEDYADAYGIPGLTANPRSIATDTGEPTRLLTLTTALLCLHRVVFFGFGLTDIYFNQVLLRVDNLMWDGQTETHYAILPLDADHLSAQVGFADELFSKMGIVVIFYPVAIDPAGDLKPDHSALESLIARIHRDVRRAGDQLVTGGEPALVGQPGETMPPWVARNNEAQLERVEARAD